MEPAEQKQYQNAKLFKLMLEYMALPLGSIILLARITNASTRAPELARQQRMQSKELKWDFPISLPMLTVTSTFLSTFKWLQYFFSFLF